MIQSHQPTQKQDQKDLLASIQKDSLVDGFGRWAPVRVNGRFCKALVDSGNLWRTCISPDFLKELGGDKSQLQPLSVTTLGTAKQGANLKVLGETKAPVKVRFGAQEQTFKVKPVVIEGLNMKMNLSGPFLKQHGIDQLHTRDCILVGGREVGLLRGDGQPARQPTQRASAVHLLKNVRIPPMAVAALPVKVQAAVNGEWPATEGMLQPAEEFHEKTGVTCYPETMTACLSEGVTIATMVNLQLAEVEIPAGTRVGTFQASLQLREEAAINLVTPQQKEPESEPAWSEERKRKWLEEEFKLKENPMLQREYMKEEVLKVLLRHWTVYSTDGSFGKTGLLKHAIHTDKGPPTKERFRPINPKLEQELRCQLEEWLKHDVIEESSSPWSFALVAVRKKNGKWRWCVDYRKLNNRTQKDSFPLPFIDDNLARLAYSDTFSAIDGMGAFHVVEIEEEDKEKTAFSTPWGLYQFKRMPFGLANGPATYSRLMMIALKDIPAEMALPYLDDTIIHSQGVWAHLEALDKVLEAHSRAGLKLQPSKCHLFQSQIVYLGHTVSRNGIEPVEDYVKVVRNWPLPTNRTQIRSFLGKVGYYRRFNKDYAALAKPWTDALGTEEGEEKVKKAAPVQVTEEMKSSFDILKKALTSAPILAFPRFDEDAAPFILDTDWSLESNTIGAVLSQEQEGEERVIAYGAKKLGPSQANYAPTKGELCAVIYFLKHWKYYLQFRKFLLRTDHEALKWIRSMDAPTGMVRRWLDVLASFDFEVQHRAGKKHMNADPLSRIPNAEEGSAGEDSEEEVVHQLGLVELRKDSRLPSLPEEWRREQLHDLDLREVRRWVEDDSWPPLPIHKGLAPVLKHYWGLQGKLLLDEQGVLRFQDPLGRGKAQGLVCVPLHLQGEVILAAHKMVGHKGVRNTLDRVLQSGHFPGARREVKRFIEGCASCQKKEDQQKGQRHTHATVPVGYPFQRLSLDFVGPLPKSKRGNVLLLTVLDTFSRWLEAFPVRSATAEAVATLLEKEIFSRYGFPEVLHSDQGAQFTSKLMKQVGELLDVALTHTPAYNPQSNPVERAHRDLKKGLRSLMEDTGKDWEEVLPQVLFASRTTINESTGLSPFQLMFGRDPSIPLTVLDQTPARWEEEEPMLDFVRRFRNRIDAAQDFARQNLKRAVQRQRRYYSDNLVQFSEGSLAWLYTPPSGEGVSRKLYRGWTGPWEIVRQITPTTYQVKSPASWKKAREVVVGINRLKRFYLPQQRLAQFETELTQEELERRGDEQCEDLTLPPLPRKRGRGEDDSDDDDPNPPPPPRWRRGRVPPALPQLPPPPPALPRAPAPRPPPPPMVRRGRPAVAPQPRAEGAGAGEPRREPETAPATPVPRPRQRWPFPDRNPGPGTRGRARSVLEGLPPTPGTAYDQRRQASQWQRRRPDTPGGVRGPDRLPYLEDFPPQFNPEEEDIPSDSTSSSSEFEFEERDLRRTARGKPPLALRRLQDSAGWRGAAARTDNQEGVRPRARAREEEQERH